MLKTLRFLVLAASAFAASLAYAVVEVNSADAAQLDSLKGVGPAMSARIIAQRKTAEFKDWSDFIDRVGGVGEKSAAKLSEAGLTVNGKPYQAATQPAAPVKK